MDLVRAHECRNRGVTPPSGAEQDRPPRSRRDGVDGHGPCPPRTGRAGLSAVLAPLRRRQGTDGRWSNGPPDGLNPGRPRPPEVGGDGFPGNVCRDCLRAGDLAGSHEHGLQPDAASRGDIGLRVVADHRDVGGAEARAATPIHGAWPAGPGRRRAGRGAPGRLAKHHGRGLAADQRPSTEGELEAGHQCPRVSVKPFGVIHHGFRCIATNSAPAWSWRKAMSSSRNVTASPMSPSTTAATGRSGRPPRRPRRCPGLPIPAARPAQQAAGSASRRGAPPCGRPPQRRR